MSAGKLDSGSHVNVEIIRSMIKVTERIRASAARLVFISLLCGIFQFIEISSYNIESLKPLKQI
jgi:hypothetical protein